MGMMLWAINESPCCCFWSHGKVFNHPGAHRSHSCSSTSGSDCWVEQGITPHAVGGAIHARMKPSPETRKPPISIVTLCTWDGSFTSIDECYEPGVCGDIPTMHQITSSAQFAMHLPSPSSGGSARESRRRYYNRLADQPTCVPKKRERNWYSRLPRQHSHEIPMDIFLSESTDRKGK